MPSKRPARPRPPDREGDAGLLHVHEQHLAGRIEAGAAELAAAVVARRDHLAGRGDLVGVEIHVVARGHEARAFRGQADKPLDATKFMPWLQNLVASEGQKILRSKGILAFTDDDDRYVFQGVHMMLEGDHQRAWKEGEARESRLVFIGRELPEQMIRDGFEGCITT